MRTIARRSAALTIFVSLALSACGGSEESSDKGIPFGAEPATGTVVKGSTYSYSVPKGWVVPPASGFDSVAADGSDNDGFGDFINVVLDPKVVDVSGNELEDLTEKVLTRAKATDIAIQDTVEIAGEEAVHARAILEQEGVKYRAERFVFDHDGKGYAVMLSFSENVPEDERDEVAGSIFATWKWVS